MRKLSLMLLTVLSFLLLSITVVSSVQSQPSGLLDPLTIPKWVNQLDGPLPHYVPANITDNNGNVIRQDYIVNVTEFYQQILPTQDGNGNPTGLKATRVWGYGGFSKDAASGAYLGFVASTPGPTFDAVRGLPVRVEWVNDLIDSSGIPLSSFLAVDPTLHWANPGTMTMPESQVNAPVFPPGYSDAQSPVAIVTHLHGGEVTSAYDGNPDAWFTANGIHGTAYNTIAPTRTNAAIYEYPNSQEPATLWYHDHALGVTRINVLSGLAGFYLLRDPSDQIGPLLPSGKYDVPLCIQDRTFLTDGSLYYPNEGNYPEIHPYWQDTFLGNTILVNGKAWPNMNVEQGLYRFRLLDASNSRFYLFAFSNNMEFVQIGSDGGYLKTQAPIKSLLMGPGERADILVDFSNVEPGTKIVLQNTALTSTSETDKQTIGQVMQFTVTSTQGFAQKTLPTELNPTLSGTYPTLQNVDKQRTLTLAESSGTNGTLAMYLDGQEWSAPISENPELGTTEEWVVANPTISAHTIHLHLVQFQIISRQLFNDTEYNANWIALNGQPPLNHTTENLPSLAPYLIGQPMLPPANEQGWKDTVIMQSGQITTIRVRFAQQDGSSFPFDATVGPGYVWHCHLLEHEDNQMMRPYVLTQPAGFTFAFPIEVTVIVIAVVVIVAILGFVAWRRNRVRQLSK